MYDISSQCIEQQLDIAFKMQFQNVNSKLFEIHCGRQSSFFGSMTFAFSLTALTDIWHAIAQQKNVIIYAAAVASCCSFEDLKGWVLLYNRSSQELLKKWTESSFMQNTILISIYWEAGLNAWKQ